MARNIVFIGSFVSFEDSNMHAGFSQAGNLFQRKLIDFLTPKVCVSLIPIFINGQPKFSFDKPVNFVNNQTRFKGAFNRLYKLVFDTVEVWKLMAKSDAKNAFFYNIDKHNFMMIAIARYILRKKTYVIVADYAQYSNRLFNWMFHRLLRASHGTVVLNSNIDCNDNSKLLLGLLYDESIYMNPSTQLKKSVLLSGSLGVTTGFELALGYFSKNPDYQLYITGRPFRYTDSQFQDLLDTYVTPNDNIQYLGLLTYEKYCEVMEDCDVALSLRNPQDIEHQYNFPSKILEYLSNSKLVISSIEYKDLPEGLLFQTEFNAESLSTTLDSIFALTPEAFGQHRQRVYDYLRENFSQAKVVSVVEALCED